MDLVRIAQPFEEDLVTSFPSGCRGQIVAAAAVVAGPDKVAAALACWHLASTYWYSNTSAAAGPDWLVGIGRQGHQSSKDSALDALGRYGPVPVPVPELPELAVYLAPRPVAVVVYLGQVIGLLS